MESKETQVDLTLTTPCSKQALITDHVIEYLRDEMCYRCSLHVYNYKVGVREKLQIYYPLNLELTWLILIVTDHFPQG